MVIRAFKKFFKWFGSFFSSKGDGSSKRATVFAVTMLYLYINYMYSKEVRKEDWLFYQLVLNAVVILLILGVATMQNVMEFFRMLRNQSKEKEEEKPEPEKPE